MFSSIRIFFDGDKWHVCGRYRSGVRFDYSFYDRAFADTAALEAVLESSLSY